MFFELRQYYIKKDQMQRWVKWMDEVLIPYQASKGMIIVGSWFMAEEDQYVWIRRFESEEDCKRLYAAVYETDYWKNEAKPIVDEMLDRERGLNVKRMQASPLSILR